MGNLTPGPYSIGSNVDGNSSTLESRITWDVGADPISDDIYERILNNNYPNLWPSAKEGLYYAMKGRHFLYFKSTGGIPSMHNGEITSYGDCQNGNVNVGDALSTVGKIGQGLAVAGQFDPEPISKAIIAGVEQFIIAPLSFIFGKHAKAVAVEQSNLCHAYLYVNPLLDDIDTYYYAGDITAAQAAQGLANARNGVAQSLASITKMGGSCNAACVMLQELDAIILLRTGYLYPMHESASQVENAQAIINNNPAMATGIKSVVSGPIGQIDGVSAGIDINAGGVNSTLIESLKSELRTTSGKIIVGVMAAIILILATLTLSGRKVHVA